MTPNVENQYLVPPMVVNQEPSIMSRVGGMVGYVISDVYNSNLMTTYRLMAPTYAWHLFCGSTPPSVNAIMASLVIKNVIHLGRIVTHPQLMHIVNQLGHGALDALKAEIRRFYPELDNRLNENWLTHSYADFPVNHPVLHHILEHPTIKSGISYAGSSVGTLVEGKISDAVVAAVVNKNL